MSASDPSPVVEGVALPVIGRMEAIQLSSPPRSGQLSPESHRTIAFEDLGDSSVALSPDRVRAGQSQEATEDGSLFDLSPLSPGILMRPSGAAGQHPDAGVLLPSALDGLDDSVLGDPIAYAQCEQIPGSDTPLTLPVYTLLSGLLYMPGQSSVQTVLASGVSSRPEGWSSATAQCVSLAREGPSGASAPPMDTEDSLLVTTGLPGCPYRFTSHSGPAISDMNPAFGSWSLSVRRGRLASCTVRRRFRWIVWERSRRQQSTCRGTWALCCPICRFCRSSLHRMSSEMLSISMGWVVFPAEEIADLSPAPGATWAATYMAAMGLWRSQTGLGDPGPVPASFGDACMN